MKMNNVLDFHADDFGISKNSCNDIFSLINDGCLNSISILPNMEHFEYGVNLLNQLSDEQMTHLNISVHLNFMEGKCCSNKDLIPDLVDEKGFFTVSWKKLFIWNYNPLKKKKIINQLKTEIDAQCRKCVDSGIYKSKKLRFDSHQHPHMIPIFQKALFSVIQEYKKIGIETEFVRNSRDILSSYIFHLNLYKTFSLVNIIKCLILNFFSHSLKRKLKKNNLSDQYLSGVFFSGNMDYERLSVILPSYAKKAEKKNLSMEVLFHPGTVLESEITTEFVKPDFNIFHLSTGRKIEFDSVKIFKEKGWIR